MRTMRLIGWFLAAITLVVLVRDAIAFISGNGWRFAALGELWFTFWREGLNFSQAIVQRYLAPELWDNIIRPVLLWPAVLFFAGLSLIFLFIGNLRRR